MKENNSTWEKVILDKKADTLSSANYAITRRREEEIIPSEEKDIEVEESTEDEIEEEEQDEREVTEVEIETKLSELSLNKEQLNALESLMNLGLDIDNSMITLLLEPISNLPYYDWEALVTKNALQPLPNPTMIKYPVDKTRQNSKQLAKHVRKYIENVLALKHQPDRGVEKQEIISMKEYVRNIYGRVNCPNETNKQRDKVVVKLVYDSNVNFHVLPAYTCIGYVKQYVMKQVPQHTKNILKLLSKDQVLQDEIRLGELMVTASEADKKFKIIQIETKNYGSQVNRIETDDEIDKQSDNECTRKTDAVTGYKNKNTSTLYYNICTQTIKPFDWRDKGLVTRSAQTPVFPLQDGSSATVQTKATQVPREEFYEDARGDRIICSRPYTETNPFEDHLREMMAVRIQRKWRKMLMKAGEKAIQEDLKELKQNELLVKNSMREEECVRQMNEMLSPKFLNTREDFYMFYFYLDNWWKNWKNTEEYKCAQKTMRDDRKIGSCFDRNRAKASRFLKKQFQVYLNKLLNIEKLMTESKGRREERKEICELKKSAKPLETVKAGTTTTISTLESQQADQLHHLYETLQRRDLSIEERIDFLLHLKQTLQSKQVELNLTERLLSLIHKEVAYLSHAIGEDKIETLRKRIELHFLKYTKSRDVNTKMSKILDGTYPLDCGHKLLRCNHCLQIKHTRAFQTESFSESVLPTCRACFFTHVIGCKQEDHSKYSTMLRHLRESELRMCALSPVTFLMTESSVHYLVYFIWGSKSIISGVTDLVRLKLGRWIIHEDWSPWNNMLVTEEEYLSHSSVKQVYTLYSPSLIHKINLLNARAKRHFNNLYELQYVMKQKMWFQEDQEQSGSVE